MPDLGEPNDPPIQKSSENERWFMHALARGAGDDDELRAHVLQEMDERFKQITDPDEREHCGDYHRALVKSDLAAKKQKRKKH